MTTFSRTVTATLLTIAAGCGVEPGADSFTSTSSAVVANNALAANALAANALAANALAANALTDPSPTGDLNRQFFKYLISCALAPDRSVSISWTGADGSARSETYAGMLGLAPGWADGPATRTDRRWVTACMAARTNAKGVTIQLSLRGQHPALEVDDAERSAFGYPEGSFYGDIFRSASEGGPVVFSCRAARGAGTPAPAPENQVGRECTNGAPGTCGIMEIKNIVCYDGSNPAHEDCRSAGGGTDAHGNSDYAYRCANGAQDEVISTWLRTN